ncbi:MAG: hypothetical protein ACFB2W_00515 [Leptolyngbyaceae cyanobacterium]
MRLCPVNYYIPKKEVNFPLMSIGIGEQILSAQDWVLRLKITFRLISRTDPTLVEDEKRFLLELVREGYQCLFELFPKTDESLLLRQLVHNRKEMNILYINLQETNIQSQEIVIPLHGDLPDSWEVAIALKKQSYAHNR